MRMRRGQAIWVLTLAVAACAPPDAPGDGGPTPVSITFEDRAVPGAFDRNGAGRRIAEGNGLWAVVTGLPRPERGRVRNLESGAETVVSLFRAPSGSDPTLVALSPEAAELLGIGDTPVAVRVTAVRREPQLVDGR